MEKASYQYYETEIVYLHCIATAKKKEKGKWDILPLVSKYIGQLQTYTFWL